MGKLFNGSLAPSHEIPGKLFWPVTRVLVYSAATRKHARLHASNNKKFLFSQLKRFKVALCKPGRMGTTLVLHPHTVDKDLGFSRHGLKPNPMASLMLTDFLKSPAPESPTELMAA